MNINQTRTSGICQGLRISCVFCKLTRLSLTKNSLTDQLIDPWVLMIFGLAVAVLLCLSNGINAKQTSGLGLGLFIRAVRDNGDSPIENSSDVWASVIANVAPWMALVGDRNAKEFLRNSSSRDQLLLMATAPLGIFSILTSAIRLSGHPLLRRVVGRESERRSEALTELTPLSVSPATSVYDPFAIEIEPSIQKDRVAYICAHTKQRRDSHLVLSSFRQLLSTLDAQTDDRDFEIVLAIKGNCMSLDDLVKELKNLTNDRSLMTTKERSDLDSASLSFRINGISPNQTASNGSTFMQASQIINILISVTLFVVTSGLHVLAYLFDQSTLRASVRLQAFTMGLVGYTGITVFTFLILNMIKQETVIKPVKLPELLNNAIWTFSDSRHSGHRFFDLPSGRSLVQSTPAIFTRAQKGRRSTVTVVLCLCLAFSFIVFYLGVRVAQYWVALGSLAIIWLSAGLRSLVIRNFLVAKKAPSEEHWLGVFHDNVYNSLLATVDMMQDTADESRNYSPSSGLHSDEKACTNPEKSITMKNTRSHSLIVDKPIRQSIQSWSGCEDVMKVALEISKVSCRTRKFTPEGQRLALPRLPHMRRVIRFHLMIWVPGLTWKAESPLDYILTETFDFPNLYRDLLKIIHLLGDVSGKISRHAIDLGLQTQLSHVLCGPVNVPGNGLQGEVDLTTLLAALRNVNHGGSKAYTLEQIMLLPTIQLASIYESFPIATTKSRIETLQNGYPDQLALSGAAFLPVLQNLLEELQIWDSFMKIKPPTTCEEKVLGPRDETSGLYGRFVGKDDQKAVDGDSLVDPKMRNRLEPMDTHLYFEPAGMYMQY